MPIHTCPTCDSLYCTGCDPKKGPCANCELRVCGECRLQCTHCGKLYCKRCILSAVTGNICISCRKEIETKKEAKANLTPAELAHRWSITVGTLNNWRVQGVGPKFIKLENLRILYPMEEVLAYEKANTKNNTV